MTGARLSEKAIQAECVVAGCGRPARVVKRGLCGMHYERWRAYGNPEIVRVTPHHEMMEWLAKNKAYSGDECLKWPFNPGVNGYGGIKIKGKSVTASRAMCIIAHGPPPSERPDAAHSCGNGRMGCCNPRHLSWKSRRDNILDRIEHGAMQRGEQKPRAVLNREQVREIRKLYASGVSGPKVGARYSISDQTVYDIASGKLWGWL